MTYCEYPTKGFYLLFWIAFFIWGSLFLTAIIYAWYRHGSPKDEMNLKPWYKPEFHFNGNYFAEVETESMPISFEVRDTLRNMVREGKDFSKESAYRYGIKREQWERLRERLSIMGLVEKRPFKPTVFTRHIYSYLRLPSPRGEDRSE